MCGGVSSPTGSPSGSCGHCARTGTECTSAPTKNGTGRRTCATHWATTSCSTSAVYSCDLGVAKPDPAFFAAAALRIAAQPASILFIDDGARNVEGARAAGLAAEQWELWQGHEVLLAFLARHGVSADLSESIE